MLDGVLCDTCMDIVILMSRTAMGSTERFHSEMTHHHNTVGLSVSTCGRTSSMSRSTRSENDWTRLDNSNHVQKTLVEQLTCRETEVNTGDVASENISTELLSTPRDRHRSRTRYYNKILVVVVVVAVLWSFSVACRMLSLCVICRSFSVPAAEQTVVVVS